MNQTESWNKVKVSLKKTQPQHAYATWFEPLVCIGLNGHDLIIEVPNQFFFEWIQRGQWVQEGSRRGQSSETPSRRRRPKRKKKVYCCIIDLILLKNTILSFFLLLKINYLY